MGHVLGKGDVFMFDEKGKNVELAAALLSAEGAAVEHDRAFDMDAEKIKDHAAGMKEVLERVITLCGTPETPREYYICTKAYSELGDNCKAISCARAYLADSSGDLFNYTTADEDGIAVNGGEAKRAGIMMDLASALENTGDNEGAYHYYSEAYRLQPYDAMAAVKCADVIAKLNGRKEALDFLLEQKLGGYYEPVAYTDALGEKRKNDLFKQLIDAHILKFTSDKAQN
jgi:tetratricopeptide (TPR) repeat protein